MEKFEQTYSYKLIYVFSMPYETHKGMLKVGEATLKTDIMPNELVPNCHTLNQAAKARIDSYTKTANSRNMFLTNMIPRHLTLGNFSEFGTKDLTAIVNFRKMPLRANLYTKMMSTLFSI